MQNEFFRSDQYAFRTIRQNDPAIPVVHGAVKTVALKSMSARRDWPRICEIQSCAC